MYKRFTITVCMAGVYNDRKYKFKLLFLQRVTIVEYSCVLVIVSGHTCVLDPIPIVE